MVPAHWKGRSISQEYKRIPAFEDALQRKDYEDTNEGLQVGTSWKLGIKNKTEDQKIRTQTELYMMQ